MLHIYISFAPDDAKYVAKLHQWLRPLEAQYFLRIWYNRAVPPPPQLPLPWNIIFFWYQPSNPRLPYHPELPARLEKGHIYLFLTSYKSINNSLVNQLEIPRAVDRYSLLGDKYVRIYPVLVSASYWKKYSRLASFTPIGPPAPLNEIEPEEDGFLELVDQLQGVIEELRANWMERMKAEGLPLDDFSRPEPPPPPPPQFITLPQWSGWLILLAILFSVTNWYLTYCRRLPTNASPYSPKPYEYRREVPVLKPQEVPLPPPDTLAPPGK